MCEIATKLIWDPLTTKDGQRYGYPADRSALSKREYCVPAVYRWALIHPNSGLEFLVGETENLYVRIGEYLRHKSPHHTKIRERFEEIANSSGEVKLEILKFDSFVINAVKFAPDTLSDLFVRRVLENLCCALLEGEGYKLLNVTSAKRRSRRLGKLADRILKMGIPIEVVEKELRQGTASAVPPKVGEESGFSR